jgi:uncharacterized membrane protein YdjX (TVP38/TMEM64 family)
MTALLAVATGMALGPLWGGIAVWVAAVSAAALEFLLARRLGQPALHRVVAPQRLAQAQRRLGRAEVPLLLAVRLLPAISFHLTNVALGMSTVGWWRFTWTTAVGVLPMTAITVASGAGLGEWASS